MADRKGVALVTGAGTGIGRAAALALQGDGYDVVVTGRRKEPLDQTVAMAKAGGGRMLAVTADVSQPDQVKELFAQAKAAFGRLDVLFNNAGGFAPGVPLEDLTFEQWQSVVGANLTSVFLCSQEAIRIMKAQTPKGGRIINNGSISAYSPRPFTGPYTATKHGVSGLTKAISLDGRAHDIACSQIDIGNAATDLTERIGQGVLQADGSIRPEPRIELEHVANAILYMANLPLGANVQSMTVMATKMPFIGRG